MWLAKPLAQRIKPLHTARFVCDGVTRSTRCWSFHFHLYCNNKQRRSGHAGSAMYIRIYFFLKIGIVNFSLRGFNLFNFFGIGKYCLVIDLMGHIYKVMVSPALSILITWDSGPGALSPTALRALTRKRYSACGWSPELALRDVLLQPAESSVQWPVPVELTCWASTR